MLSPWFGLSKDISLFLRNHSAGVGETYKPYPQNRKDRLIANGRCSIVNSLIHTPAQKRQDGVYFNNVVNTTSVVSRHINATFVNS